MSGEFFQLVKCKDCQLNIGLLEVSSGETFCATPCLLKRGNRNPQPSTSNNIRPNNVNISNQKTLAPSNGSPSRPSARCNHYEDPECLPPPISDSPTPSLKRESKNVSQGVTPGSPISSPTDRFQRSIQRAINGKNNNSNDEAGNSPEISEQNRASAPTAPGPTPGLAPKPASGPESKPEEKRITVTAKKRLLTLTCQKMDFPCYELNVKYKVKSHFAPE